MRALPVGGLDAFAWPILILAPHPDDETLGCGGLIAAACAAGLAIRVLVLTDGTGSHPASRAYPAPRLRRLREQESRRAGAALGLASGNIAFLGLPDTAAPHAGPPAAQAAHAIAAHMQASGARTLLTTWRHDPHCDHRAASLLGARAAGLHGAALWEYPVWGWTLPARRLLRDPAPRGIRLDVSAHLPAKRRAIAAHRSQLGQVITDDPGGFTLEQPFIALFAGRFETFLRINPADRAAPPADDPPGPKSPPA